MKIMMLIISHEQWEGKVVPDPILRQKLNQNQDLK
jgi:hypothetical protein